MELRLPLEMSPGREAACRAVFGTWGFFRTMHGLRPNVRKTKIKTSGPITSWQIEGGKEEVVTDFLFLGCKITADGDCSHEIGRQLLLGRKSVINLDCVEKQRHYSANKGP